KVSPRDQERLTQAARPAWRDGEAAVPGITRGNLPLDVQVVRTGRVDDYLLWRFASVRAASVMDDYLGIIEGEAGRQISEAGVMCAMIGGEGRIRAANLAFTLRATGRLDSNIIGRDFASYMRVDGKGRIFFAQEERQAVPIRMIQVPLRPDDPASLLVLIMIDE